MFMPDPRIQYLIAKKLHGTITGAEQEELDAWINASSANRAFMERMLAGQAEEKMEAFSLVDDERILDNFRQLTGRQGSQAIRRGRLVRIVLRVMAAAAVIIALVVPLWYLLNKNHRKGPEGGDSLSSQLAAFRRKDSMAVILSGDGKVVPLESSPVGLPVQGTGYTSSRTGKRSISFQLTPETGNQRTSPWVALVSVPYGQRWQLTLWEGSQVDLGPGAVLAIPRGASAERALLLDGEAYFQVARGKDLPFRVSTADVEVDVLGTSFNIRSFSNEHTVTTTLLSGKVKVSRGGYCNILLPGEEAVVDPHTESMRILSDVDTADRMAWRSPYFDFNDKTIPQVMRQVARWYGIKDIFYQRGIDTVSKGLLGGGHVGKDLPLSQLLKRLELESHMIFRNDARTILIGFMKYKRSPVKFTGLAYAPAL